MRRIRTWLGRGGADRTPAGEGAGLGALDASPASRAAGRAGRRGGRDRQRGVALVAVVAAIAIIAAATVEFSTNTTVDYLSAVNARDDMRAYFLARSSMNLSRIVIKVQKDIIDKNRRMLGDLQLADYLPLMIGAFGGGKDEAMSMAAALGVATGPDGVKGLGLPEGEFDLEVSTDDGKINMNCANGSEATQKRLADMLTALVLPAAYDRVFEERDAEGQFTDRATFVRALIDYVDRDTAAYGTGGQAEDYGYPGLDDDYLAKDNYLDSVDELQLVRGMDDRRWGLFGSAFTVYGGCKVNVSAANDLAVLLGIMVASAKDPNDPLLSPIGFPNLVALAVRVAQARSMGMYFDDLNSFAEFVKSPDSALQSLLEAAAEVGGTSASAAGLTGQMMQGLELDSDKLAQVAFAGGRRTYRIVATAKIGRVEKKLTGVWDTETQNQNMRDPAYARGTWVHWREE